MEAAKDPSTKGTATMSAVVAPMESALAKPKTRIQIGTSGSGLTTPQAASPIQNRKVPPTTVRPIPWIHWRDRLSGQSQAGT